MRLVSADPVNALRVVLEADGGAMSTRLIAVDDLAGLGVVVSGGDGPPLGLPRLSGKKGRHMTKTAKRTAHTRVRVEEDGHGNLWVSQNELGRRMQLSGAGIQGFLKTHAAKLEAGVHIRDGEGCRLLYSVEAVMDLREKIQQAKEVKRAARFPVRSDETALDRAMAASRE